MGICRDKSTQYLHQLGFNVVRLPSADISPLQVIGTFNGTAGIIGEIQDLVLEGSLAPPEIKRNLDAPTITGRLTSKMPIALSGNILDGLAAGLGFGGRASAGFDSAYALEFHFEDVRRDSAKLNDIGTYLQNSEIDWSHLILGTYMLGKGRLYVIRETIKSRSFSVTAYDRKGQVLKVDADALHNLGSGSVSVSHHKAVNNAIRFEGTVDLSFGFVADAFFAVDDARTGFLTLGFAPVPGGQIALGSSALGPRVPTLGDDILEALPRLDLRSRPLTEGAG